MDVFPETGYMNDFYSLCDVEILAHALQSSSISIIAQVLQIHKIISCLVYIYYYYFFLAYFLGLVCSIR